MSLAGSNDRSLKPGPLAELKSFFYVAPAAPAPWPTTGTSNETALRFGRGEGVDGHAALVNLGRTIWELGLPAYR